MKNRIGMVFCAFALFAGCAASNEETNGAPQEPKGVWAGQAKDRASFDMNCPKEQIQLSYIKKADFSGGPVFGARGCNKRASYSADTVNGVVLRSPVSKEEAATP